jgi:hypothetical protein
VQRRCTRAKTKYHNTAMQCRNTGRGESQSRARTGTGTGTGVGLGQAPTRQVPSQQTPWGVLAQPPPGQHAQPAPPQGGGVGFLKMEASAPLRVATSAQSIANVTATSRDMSPCFAADLLKFAACTCPLCCKASTVEVKAHSHCHEKCFYLMTSYV